MKADRNNYEIIVTETKSRHWKKKAFDSTVRFNSNVSDLNSYLMEHSPLRQDEYCIEMKNIPSFVSVHMVRHKIGVEHFVLTSRDDRINKEINSGSSLTYKGFTQKALNEIFEYKDGELYWKIHANSKNASIGDKSGGLNKSLNRWVITYKNEKMYRSVIVFVMLNGYKPPIVDHIDRNTLNDKIENLRASTKQLNAMNSIQEVGKEVAYKGVRRKGDSYNSSIYVGDHSVFLGVFSTPEDAAIAYDKAALEYFGEYAYVNFPDIVENIPHRLTPVNHTMFVNAEALINIARKRLCLCSHKETVYIMNLIKKEIEKKNHLLAKMLVPNCVYRNGLCKEGKFSCGFKDEIMKKYSYYKEMFV